MENETKKKPSIPILPSLGKKYSNFEAYLHSRISKNHYLYNEKLVQKSNQQTTQVHSNDNNNSNSQENFLNGIIQCKHLFDAQVPSLQLESISKFSFSNNSRKEDSSSSSYSLRQNNKDANSFGLHSANLNLNSRNCLNNSEHEERANSIKSSNKHKPLTNNNKNYNNNIKLNHSSSSCNAINIDLINNNNDRKHDFKNLINNYSMEFDLPSNMLILSGKNCQINPNRNEIEGVKEQSIISNKDELVEEDKYLEIDKQKNISKIPSQLLYTQSKSNDNRKIILDLKNALRSYCFKYSKKQKSLENFNAKIRSFNRIQMTKRRDELKTVSNKEKLEQDHFISKQSITGSITPSLNHPHHRGSMTSSCSVNFSGKVLIDQQKEDEFEEIQEELINADQEEDDEFDNIYYYENTDQFNELNLDENDDDIEVDDESKNRENYILIKNKKNDQIIEEYDDEYIEQDHLNEDEQQQLYLNRRNNQEEEEDEEETNLKLNQKKNNLEPKLSKINIEFINRFKKNKQSSRSFNRKQQQQHSLTINEETDRQQQQQQEQINNNYEKSLDTFAIVNNYNNNKPKSRRVKNRKEENVTNEKEELKMNSNKIKQKNNRNNKSKTLSAKKTKETTSSSSNKEITYLNDQQSSSSSSSFSTSAKSENKVNTTSTKLNIGNEQKQLRKEELKENILNYNNKQEHLEAVEENEINLRNKNKLENQNLDLKFDCTSSPPPLTTITSNRSEQRANELNNSINYNNNNIKHVFEKTSLLVKNFYKNFDLLKETQDLSEQIVSSKMYSTTTVDQKTVKPSKNTLLTNSTSNLLINTAIGLNTVHSQISPNALINQQQQQQPHWVNIATIGNNSNYNNNNLKTSNNNNKVFSSNESAIYLYSEMPMINATKITSSNNNNNKLLGRKNNKLILNHFRNGFEESLAVSPVRTLNGTSGEAKLLRLASIQQQQQQQNNNKQIILLKRDKAGKLIPIEATTTTSFKQQHHKNSLIRSTTEEAFLTETNDLLCETSSNINLNDYLKLPNLMKTKLSIDQFNKQQQQTSNINNNSSTQNRDPNYVLAQMTKYQRQNAINFLKLTNKTTSSCLFGSTDQVNNSYNSTNTRSSLSSNVNKTNNSPEQQQQPIKTSSPSPPPPPSTQANIATTTTTTAIVNQQIPILVRGNSFIVAKDISNQIINQQQQLNSLTTLNQQQITKPKLSQIKFKSKNRPIIISSISDFNFNNQNDTLLPSSTLDMMSPENSECNESANVNLDESHIQKEDSTTTTTELNNEIITEECVSSSSTSSMSHKEHHHHHHQHKKHKKEKKQNSTNKKIIEIEPTLNKCLGLYTFAATSSSQLKDAAYFSNNMKRTKSSSINYLNYNTEAFLSNSTEDIIASLLMTQQSDLINKKMNNKKQIISNELVTTPLKIKNTFNNRQIFKDLEFIYNEQQVIKLQRQILIQIRQQNYLHKQQRIQQEQQQQQINEDETVERDDEQDQLTTPNNNNNNNNTILNSNYSYDYDVYKFYERNKTSSLLNSLQQQSKIKTSKQTNSSSSNKLNQQDSDQVKQEVNEDEEEEDSFENNNNLVKVQQ